MNSSEKHNQKRQQFEQPAKPKNNANRVIGIALGVLALLIGAIALSGRNAASGGLTVADGMVRIPLQQVSDGQAKFFSYKTSSNKTVRFFVIRSSDGVYRAAADACDVCYREKMGYQQDGDDMVCRKCSQRFPSAYINEVSGGCNPSGIPQTVQGDTMLIATADLESRAVFF
jgi:uncharacterized membrane protein